MEEEEQTPQKSARIFMESGAGGRYARVDRTAENDGRDGIADPIRGR